MKKRVLVTGANGAVGKEAVRFLVERKDRFDIICLDHNTKRTQQRLGKFKNDVSFVQADITNIKTLEPVIKDLDYVIHLAAIIPPLADKKPDLARAVNFEGTKNIIELIEKNSPNVFMLYASSISVYGDRLNTPNIKVGDPLKASMGDEYGQTKIDTEKAIQESNIKWSIFRLTGIMDAELNKPNALMFHMPLETSFELCTTRDCGRAFANALDHQAVLENTIFNLAGGESCRAPFHEILRTAFGISGLGKLNFPEGAFATANFHCGYYADGDDLENILRFRQDSKEDYFNMMSKAIPEWQKFSARIFAPIIKWVMLQTSDPWKAKKTNDKYGMKRYFNIDV